VQYGEAWESRDSGQFCALFSGDAPYHWTPIDPPLRGHGDIGAAFTDAVSEQDDIRFSHQVLAVVGMTGICRWQCSFDRTGSGRRVHLDGVFVVSFDDTGLCREFREWWHSSEPPQEKTLRS
jgi:hypothetical protein